MKLFTRLLILLLPGMSISCRKTTGSTVTDIDGNVYSIVKIGTQYWMAQNLRVTRYCNGDSIPLLTNDTAWGSSQNGARCYYNNYPAFIHSNERSNERRNDSAFVKAFGCLYNWYAVNDARKLAPAGWHIPTRAELDILVKNLRGDTLAGAYMKAAGWNMPDIRIPVSDGFNALPCGYRTGSPGSFHTSGSNGYWWHTTGSYELFAWSPRFYSTFADVKRDPQYYTYGLSVRCIRD